MQFCIQILGSGSAIPTLNRGGSAQYVNIHGHYLLLDCGEGTQLKLRQYKIKMQKINHIFISHLHGDHFFGVAGLLSTLHLMGQKKTVYIYAPQALEKIIYDQFEVSGTVLQYELKFIPLNDNGLVLIYDEKKFQVFSFPLKHKIPTWGFLIKEKPIRSKLKKSFINSQQPDIESIKKIIEGKDFVNRAGVLFKNKEITIPPRKALSYAYCSDTVYDESMIEYIRGVNVLYHEASFANDMINQATSRLHSTAMQAAIIAKKAQVNQLIIGHFSTRYDDISPLLEEARSVFPNTVAAEDGLKLELL